MSSNVLNLLPHLTPGQPQLMLGSVSVKQPAPTDFSSPLYVELPDWSDQHFFTIHNWPTCHGSLLPQCGADVLILVDNQRNMRVVWWDGVTGFPPPSVGSNGGHSSLPSAPGAYGAFQFSFPTSMPASIIGGVTVPALPPNASGQVLKYNGAGGSTWA